jgi:hypothetical protein
MRSAPQTREHPARVIGVDWFAQGCAVGHDQRVGGEDHFIHVAAHHLRFGRGHVQRAHKRVGQQIGAFVDVGGCSPPW